MAEKEITIEIKNPEIIILLIFLSVVFFLELQVTLNSPIVFGDEGYHARMSQHFAEEQEYPVWYPYTMTKVSRDDFARPAFYNILQGSLLFFFGSNEILFKFFIPLLSFLTGITTYLLVKKIYNKEIAFLTTLIATTVPSFVTYSVLVYTDILFTLYLTLFFLLFILAIRDKKKKYWILSSVFGGLAIFTKIPGLVIFLFMGVVFLYQLKKERRFLKLFKKYIFMILIISIIIGPWLLRNLYYYRNPLCYSIPFFDISGCRVESLDAKYFTSEETEEVVTEENVFRMGIANYLEFAYGPIWFFTFLFLSGLIFLYFSRKDTDILILLILVAMGMFIVLRWNNIFNRAENAARYTLGFIAILSLIASSYLENIYKFVKKYQKYVTLVVFLIVIFLGYQNLVSKLDVMKSVKQFSPAFFEACDWIKENLPEDACLNSLWSHRVVYNCQRRVCNHPDLKVSRDVNHTISIAEKVGTTHFFIQKYMITSDEKAYGHPVDFVNFLEDHPDAFIKLYENGPTLQQCLQQGGCDGTIVYEINYSYL